MTIVNRRGFFGRLIGAVTGMFIAPVVFHPKTFKTQDDYDAAVDAWYASITPDRRLQDAEWRERYIQPAVADWWNRHDAALEEAMKKSWTS